MTEEIVNRSQPKYKLKTGWTLWFHLLNNNDWTMNAYYKICDFTYVEEVITILSLLNEELLTNCYLFMMRKNVEPRIEDPVNCKGGCFKYRITNKYVMDTFKDLSYVAVGDTISTSKLFNDNVTGITISPKKNFCVIKIWMQTMDFQNPALITKEIKNLVPTNAIFVAHEES